MEYYQFIINVNVSLTENLLRGGKSIFHAGLLGGYRTTIKLPLLDLFYHKIRPGDLQTGNFIL